jgi:WD40 repeat protein
MLNLITRVIQARQGRSNKARTSWLPTTLAALLLVGSGCSKNSDKGKPPPKDPNPVVVLPGKEKEKDNDPPKEKDPPKEEVGQILKKDVALEAQLAVDALKARMALKEKEEKILAALARLPGVRSKAGEIGYLTDAYSPMTFSPDGALLAVCKPDPKTGGTLIRIMDFATGKEIHQLPGHDKEIKHLTFSADGSLLFSAAQDNCVKQWDVKTGKLQKTIPLDVIFESFCADGKTMVGKSGGIVILDAKTGKEQAKLKTGILVGSVAVSQSGKRAATSVDKKVTLWDLSTQKKIAESTADFLIGKMAFSPDGWSLVLQGIVDIGNWKLVLWDLESNKQRLLRERLDLRSVAFSPDGKFLVYSSAVGLGCIDLSTGKEGRLLMDSPSRFTRFSPGGNILAVSMGTATYFWPAMELLDPAGMADPAALDEFAKLGEVRWRGKSVAFLPYTNLPPGDGLAKLKGLAPVTELYLGYLENLRDADLGPLKDISRLELISLAHSKTITDAGLAHLQALDKLKSLDLTFALKITDAGLANLKKMSKLEALNLTGAPISDKGLEHLAGLSELKSLKLKFVSISSAGLANFKGMAKLDTLELDGQAIDDAGLAYLAGMSKMASLNIEGTKIMPGWPILRT